MTYTQAQIERAARVIVGFDNLKWEYLKGSSKAEYIDLATEVARELDGGE